MIMAFNISLVAAHFFGPLYLLVFRTALQIFVVGEVPALKSSYFLISTSLRSRLANDLTYSLSVSGKSHKLALKQGFCDGATG